MKLSKREIKTMEEVQNLLRTVSGMGKSVNHEAPYLDETVEIFDGIMKKIL